jgi:hypothetical protein
MRNNKQKPTHENYLLELGHPTRHGVAVLLPLDEAAVRKVIVEARVVLILGQHKLLATDGRQGRGKSRRDSEEDERERLHGCGWKVTRKRRKHQTRGCASLAADRIQ